MAQSTNNQQGMSAYKSGTRSGRAVNDAAVHNSAKSTHNVFPMSYSFGQTARYAEIGAFFAMNAEARDVVPLKSSFELRSLALRSPKMSPLFMKRVYFEVKQNAILPRTFEYIYKNPVQGDDVPEDAYCNYRYPVGTRVPFTEYIWQELKSVISDLYTNAEYTDADTVILTIRGLQILESIYSNGSLLASLGCPLNGYVLHDDSDFVFDVWISNLIKKFITTDNQDESIVFTFPDLVHSINPDRSNADYTVGTYVPEGVVGVSYTRMLELLRSYTPSNVVVVKRGAANIPINTYLNGANFDEVDLSLEFSWPQNGVDVSRLAAYQLTCAEWYTNDKVDYIYNADLWRKAQDFYVRQILNQVYFFDYNDIAIMYDALSAKNWYSIQDALSDGDIFGDPEQFSFYFDFLANLFFFNRSLKFEDYFSGARTRPLAVGDPTIFDPQNPLEVVHGIQLTRFLNAVNRAGMDEDYLAQIYGTLPLPDDQRPKWIATYDDRIDSFEVNNTAEDQGKMTTALRSYSSKDHEYTALEVSGYPSIILGLYSFEMPRYYVQAIDRDFFVQDRFDMFNPYYQYDGDQVIYRSELFPVTGDADDASFAYTGRDNHRKMRISRASGGFVRNLPSWLFTVDDKGNGIPLSNLSPEFILSSSSEFDRFFAGFPDPALDGYFHFIINFVNTCNAVRPMEFAPAILNG